MCLINCILQLSRLGVPVCLINCILQLSPLGVPVCLIKCKWPLGAPGLGYRIKRYVEHDTWFRVYLCWIFLKIYGGKEPSRNRARIFKLLRSPEIDSASLFSLAGRYNNHIPTRYLAPIECLKIPALVRWAT